MFLHLTLSMANHQSACNPAFKLSGSQSEGYYPALNFATGQQLDEGPTFSSLRGQIQPNAHAFNQVNILNASHEDIILLHCTFQAATHEAVVSHLT